MVKYNYKGVAALWDEYFDLCVCDMSFCGQEKQQERRQFMRTITRKDEDIKLYLDYITEQIENARPVEGVKSRCFDFEYERQLEELKYKIVNFSHCIERYAEV